MQAKLVAFDMDDPLPGAWCPICMDHCAYTRRLATEQDGQPLRMSTVDHCPECQWVSLVDP